jgi:hypothetical protein
LRTATPVTEATEGQKFYSEVMTQIRAMTKLDEYDLVEIYQSEEATDVQKIAVVQVLRRRQLATKEAEGDKITAEARMDNPPGDRAWAYRN